MFLKAASVLGEEVADVGQGGGTEESVADGVGEAVGIAVAFESVVGGEADAAEDEGATWDDAVDVVAVADAEIHHRGLTTKCTKDTKKIRTDFGAELAGRRRERRGGVDDGGRNGLAGEEELEVGEVGRMGDLGIGLGILEEGDRMVEGLDGLGVVGDAELFLATRP